VAPNTDDRVKGDFSFFKVAKIKNLKEKEKKYETF
jgi:hypothetical protein